MKLGLWFDPDACAEEALKPKHWVIQGVAINVQPEKGYSRGRVFLTGDEPYLSIIGDRHSFKFEYMEADFPLKEFEAALTEAKEYARAMQLAVRRLLREAAEKYLSETE